MHTVLRELVKVSLTVGTRPVSVGQLLCMFQQCGLISETHQVAEVY